jgi:hypothetical protein
MSAKRITITISEEDKLWLDGYTKVHKISLAEAIRHGIRHLKQGERQKTYQKLLENTCGIWKQGDGLAYQEKMRTEWE